MDVSMAQMVALLVGAAFGAAAVYFFLKGRLEATEARATAGIEVERARLQQRIEAATEEEAELRARLSQAQSKAAVLQASLDALSIQRAQFEERASRVVPLESRVQDLARSEAALQARVAELAAELQAQREQATGKQKELTEVRAHFTKEFELLANRILDEKSKTFSQQNEQSLNQLLGPLKERLKDFQQKVEDVYVKEGKDRSALSEQVRQLMQLNQMLSQDAQNLALALKGDRKAQGNFGEIILEDILERAGLLKGQHYDAQAGIRDNDGESHVIPDVVIRLPGDRQIVVDSKLTLPDYRLFVEAPTEEEKAAALKRHLTSIRAHIKRLSQQNYQSLYGLTSLDCVVMFVPLEPAFTVAVTHDAELFHDAWSQNVMLVSPSTLLFVVRTVAYLWRQEDQKNNARAISARGAELYDKLCGFVSDLQKVGERIDQAQLSYSEARRKLSEGPGNVIRQAEMLRDMGVKPSKTLPAKLTEAATSERIEIAALAPEQPARQPALLDETAP